MVAVVMDGKALAAEWEPKLSQRVAALKEKSGGNTPVLATILVGDDPASATYVRMKANAEWLYHRFNLSHRDTEDLLSERGINVSFEVIRLWRNKFGAEYAQRL